MSFLNSAEMAKANAKIVGAQQNLETLGLAIDAAVTVEKKKELFFETASLLGQSWSSTRTHRALEQLSEGTRPAAQILQEMVDRETQARQFWIDKALQPWCVRHGLTLRQGLSVLFDDNAFNPDNPEKDLITKDAVFSYGGAQNDFAWRLMAEVVEKDKLQAEAQARSAVQVIHLPEVQRWDVIEGSEQPFKHEPTYDIRVTASAGQVNVDITPVGFDAAMAACVDRDPTMELPQLSAIFEINNGAPCLHVHGSYQGQLAQSIFGMPDGRVSVRQVDDPGMRELVDHVADNFDAPLHTIADRFAHVAQGQESSVLDDAPGGQG